MARPKFYGSSRPSIILIKPLSIIVLTLMRQPNNGFWIDGFLAFRDDFEFARSAQHAIAAFAQLRRRHQEPAKIALGEVTAFSSKASKMKATRNTRKLLKSITHHRSNVT